MEHMMTIVQQVKAEGMTSEQKLEANKKIVLDFFNAGVNGSDLDATSRHGRAALPRKTRGARTMKWALVILAGLIAPVSAMETANASCMESMMVKVGLLVEIDIKPELAAEFEGRLRATLPAIEEEPGTVVWFAIRVGSAKYAVVDVFPDDASRQEHLDAGRVRLAAIKDLFASPPRITRTDVIAAKIPSQQQRDCKSAD